ncbi:MAG: hypothetical protein ABI680_07800 [Chthoniobacteraceae bacterium]
MKLLPFITLSVGVLALPLVAHGESLRDFLTAGQVALQKGDLATTKKNLEIVYRMDPRNPVAIGLLKQIAVQEKNSNKAGDTQEKALAQVIIPKLAFKEATFDSTLSFLKAKVAEVSGGKQSVNFVVQPSVDQKQTVTLNLTNIPASEAIRYLGELTNTRFDFQKFAIMVSAKGTAVATTDPKAPAQ